MTYNNNVPLANQTKAQTQQPILNNFAYLQTAIGTEHNFNTSTPGATYHKQASMPNMADPGSVPSGTNGIYYIGSSFPKFYSSPAGVNFFQLAPTDETFQFFLSGSVSLSSSGSPTTVFTLPSFSFGTYWVINQAAGHSGTYACGLVTSGNTSVNANAVSDPGIDVTVSGLNVLMKLTSSSDNGTYKYIVQYYTP